MLTGNLKKYNRKRLIEMRYDVRLDTAKSTRIKIPDGKISRMPKVRSRRNISRRIPLVTRKANDANVRRGLAVVDATYDGVVLRRNAMLPYTFHGTRAAGYISRHQYVSTARRAVVNMWPKDIGARYYDANERIRVRWSPHWPSTLVPTINRFAQNQTTLIVSRELRNRCLMFPCVYWYSDKFNIW